MKIAEHTRGGGAIALMLAALFLSPGPVSAGDRGFSETLAVERGQELVVLARSGYVVVSTGDTDEIQIRANHSEQSQVQVLNRPSNIKVYLRGDKGDLGNVSFDIIVPAWMDVSIEGRDLDVECEDLGGKVSVEVSDGDIYVNGGRDRININCIQGDIRIEEAVGRVEASSTNGHVSVLDSEGQILAEAINGNIRMVGVVSDIVEALSFNGDVLYDGTIDPGGDYYFGTHDGEIQIGLSPEADATVLVLTAMGELSTDFDVRLEKSNTKGRLEFTLGEGTAKLRVESFSGDIEFFDPKQGRRKRGR